MSVRVVRLVEENQQGMVKKRWLRRGGEWFGVWCCVDVTKYNGNMGQWTDGSWGCVEPFDQN